MSVESKLYFWLNISIGLELTAEFGVKRPGVPTSWESRSISVHDGSPRMFEQNWRDNSIPTCSESQAWPHFQTLQTLSL